VKFRGKFKRRHAFQLVIVLMVLAGWLIAFTLLHKQPHKPLAQLQIVTQTPTNGGQLVHFKIIPTYKGRFMVDSVLHLGYNRMSELKSATPGIGFGGIYSGVQEFDSFFPTDYPVWRLQVQVANEENPFDHFKSRTVFTWERLKGYGWFPTPPQFINLWDGWNAFMPTRPKLVVSDVITMTNALPQP
jgi:hypothetical protein